MCYDAAHGHTVRGRPAVPTAAPWPCPRRPWTGTPWRAPTQGLAIPPAESARRVRRRGIIQPGGVRSQFPGWPKSSPVSGTPGGAFVSPVRGGWVVATGGASRPHGGPTRNPWKVDGGEAVGVLSPLFAPGGAKETLVRPAGAKETPERPNRRPCPVIPPPPRGGKKRLGPAASRPFPRVARRPPCGGPRFTRGYIPRPRWGREALQGAGKARTGRATAPRGTEGATCKVGMTQPGWPGRPRADKKRAGAPSRTGPAFPRL